MTGERFVSLLDDDLEIELPDGKAALLLSWFEDLIKGGVVDASGHVHAPPGSSEGGRFVSAQGGAGGGAGGEAPPLTGMDALVEAERLRISRGASLRGRSVYHTTSDEAAASIFNEGLYRGKSWLGREPAVYFSGDLATAKLYADVVANAMSAEDALFYGVVEFKTPQGAQPDMEDRNEPGLENSWFVNKDIPADDVVAIHMFDIDTHKLVRTMRKPGKAQLGRRAFAVVWIVPPSVSLAQRMVATLWPDGSRDRRSYFIGAPEHAASFAPEEGKPVLLRAHESKVKFRRESTGDSFVRERIPPKHLDFLGADGAWHALTAKQPAKRLLMVALATLADVDGKGVGVVDASGHTHAPSGSSEGGRFTSGGGAGPAPGAGASAALLAAARQPLPIKPWKDPPAPRGTGTIASIHGGVNYAADHNTGAGRLGEAIAEKLGFVNLHPGKSQGRFDVAAGTMVFEVKGCSIDAKEYKIKPSADAMEAKLAEAKRLAKFPGSMIVVLEPTATTMKGHVYWKHGLSNARLTPGNQKTWNYAGTTSVPLSVQHERRDLDLATLADVEGRVICFS